MHLHFLLGVSSFVVVLTTGDGYVVAQNGELQTCDDRPSNDLSSVELGAQHRSL